MKILVTGAYGFIGSYFIKMILNETDHEVIGFSRTSNDHNRARLNPKDYKRNFIHLHGDFSNPNDVSGILENVDIVFHFGAKTFVDHSIRDPNPFIQSNIVGTYNLLEEARKSNVKVFHQASTDEVYGSILTGAHTEESRLNPGNPYSATKAASDSLALSYFNTYKLNTVITRSENICGPYQHVQKVIPAFIKRILKNESVPIYGDGQHKRMWLHVEDNCAGIYLAVLNGTPGAIYNVAESQELTNLDLAKMILDLMKKPHSLITFVDDKIVRPGHDRRYAIDSSKLKTLGWKQKYDLEQTIAKTVQWYLENQWWL